MQVTEMGSYLGWLDLGIIASARKKNVICVWHTDDSEALQFRSLSCYMRTTCGFNVDDAVHMDPDPAWGCKNTWFVVSCRADLEPAPVQYANHFVPAWHKLQLGEEGYKDCYQYALQPLTHYANEVEERLLKLMETGDSESSEAEEVNDGLVENLLDIQKNLNMQINFLKQCSKYDLVPDLVPADGNCGLWSCLSLLSDVLPHARPIDYERQPEQVQELREDSWNTWENRKVASIL